MMIITRPRTAAACDRRGDGWSTDGLCLRWRHRRSTWQDGGRPFDPDRFRVVPLDTRADKRAARQLVLDHHYAAAWLAARLCYGLIDRTPHLDDYPDPHPSALTAHGRLVGVAVLSVPQHVAVVANPFPGLTPYTEALDLGRFLLLDPVGANGESWFLARAFRLARRHGIRGVVAFSDPVPRRLGDTMILPGHVGWSYQGHNATYIGRSSADPQILLPDGTSLPGRAISKLTGGEVGGRGVAARLARLGAPAPAADEAPTAWLAQGARHHRRDPDRPPRQTQVRLAARHRPGGTAGPARPAVPEGTRPGRAGHRRCPMTALDPTRPVVLSLGMGVDSVALLTRWLLDPDSRGFDLDRLVVLTAMTGDEYATTGALMTTHVLPLLRHNSVRYVQLSRAGQSRAAGYAVLDDSRTPTAMHMRGPWRLSDELRANATVPQVAHGQRRCSIRAKGEPLDSWIADHIGGDYTHVIGFGAHEQRRIDRDTSYTRNARRPVYPLASWNWDRARARAYLTDVYGARWKRSCCTYCPFSASSPDELAERWRREPQAARDALDLEYTALACNPRSALFGRTTAHEFAARHGLTAALRHTAQRRATGQWSLIEIRRVYTARRGQPTGKGTAWRSLRQLATGDHATLRGDLGRRAAAAGVPVDVDQLGVHRAWLRRAAPPYPSVEQLLLLAPAGAVDKQRKGFDRLWTSTTTEQQLALFDTAALTP